MRKPCNITVMVFDASLTVRQRPERDFKGLWGIYSEQSHRWLDVVFRTEHEARQSCDVLRGTGAAGR
jgi:hypothetical protein